MVLCFLTNVYNEWELAERGLRTIRRLYPDSHLIVCSDGGDNKEFREICQFLDVDFYAGYRVKLLNNGAQWVTRQLMAFSAYPDCSHYLKFDPDSLFLRRFNQIPEGDIFGNLRNNGWMDYVQGGCIGLSSEALIKLLKCGLFNHPIYSQTRYGYQRYQPPYLAPGEHPTGDWFVAGDIVLSTVARILQLRFTQWDECCCYTHQIERDRALAGIPTEEVPKKFAVIHPWKTLELDGIQPDFWPDKFTEDQS